MNSLDVALYSLQRLALAGLILCAAALSITWIVRTTFGLVIPERKVYIAPLTITGPGHDQEHLGRSMALFLQARVMSLRNQLKQVSTLLQEAGGRTSSSDARHISRPEPATVREEIFRPLNIPLVVAGLDVGTLLGRGHEFLIQNRLTQIAIHFDGEDAAASGDLTAMGLGALWVSGDYSSISGLVTDIAYAIVQQEQGTDKHELALMDLASFRQVVELLSRISELNAQLKENIIDADAYRHVLQKFEELNKTTSIHWLPLLEIMGQVAETSGDTKKAIQLYLDVLEALPEHALARRKHLNVRVDALQTGTATKIILSEGVAAPERPSQRSRNIREREIDVVRLKERVAATRALLEQSSRERAPLDWAATQNNLGTELQALGEHTGDMTLVEQAIAAYRASLAVYTRERAPLDWAATQTNLGTALQALGERRADFSALQAAEAAYRASLEEYTRERLPLQWATAQNNLGASLRSLAELTGDISLLEGALAAYHASLEEYTRERAPLDWAATQNNLGTALQALGQLRNEAMPLEQAIAAYRASLEEYTRERLPLQWASTQNNLGTALRVLADLTADTSLLEDAVVAYRASLEEYTRERAPLDWAATQNNLGTVLSIVATRENSTERLDDAIAAYEQALSERTRERVPLQWAQTKLNLGLALQDLAEQENNTERLDEAIEAYGEAIRIFEDANAPNYVSRIKDIIEEAERLRASVSG